MNDPSTSAPDSNEELLRLFWQRFGHGRAADEGTPRQHDAARRIVAAIGPSPEAVVLAAALAEEFSLTLPKLADAFENPSRETLGLTAVRPAGGALIAATAVREGQRQQDGGDLPAAEHAFRWAAHWFHALGERQAEGLALTLLGRVVEMQDRLEEAAQCYQEALAIDQAEGDEFNEGVDLGLLGQVAWLRGQLDDAERFARQALALHRRYRNGTNAGASLATLGEVARERGQRRRARFYFLQSTRAKRGLSWVSEPQV